MNEYVKNEANVPLTVMTCQKCGKQWSPRPAKGRRVCPKCHSINWDIPPEKKEDEKKDDKEQKMKDVEAFI